MQVINSSAKTKATSVPSLPRFSSCMVRLKTKVELGALRHDKLARAVDGRFWAFRTQASSPRMSFARGNRAYMFDYLN